jgi:hypothetical protein
MKVQEAIDAAKAEIEKTKTVNASVRVAFSRYADIFEASKDDPEEIQAAVDQLRAENESMAALVEANTPAPTPAPE